MTGLFGFRFLFPLIEAASLLLIITNHNYNRNQQEIKMFFADMENKFVMYRGPKQEITANYLTDKNAARRSLILLRAAVRLTVQ